MEKIEPLGKISGLLKMDAKMWFIKYSHSYGHYGRLGS
jgi:hypothetical protein